MPVLAIEGTRFASDGDGAPCSPPPPQRTDHHVRLNRRMLVPDKASQRIEVPVRGLWELEERVGLRTACLQPGDAAPGGVKELTRAAERQSKGLLKLARVSKLGAQTVDELERRNFPLDRQHVRVAYNDCPAERQREQL